MKAALTWVLLAGALGLGGAAAAPSALQAAEVFVTIGGGDPAGVYFPVGRAIAVILNQGRSAHGIRATVEATAGAVFNINAITTGHLEFGLTQADKQHEAFQGQAEWAAKGPQTELRSVLSLYHESLTLVAAGEAGIASVADLKGKRVSLGNPGSSQHRMVLEALEAHGIDPQRDIQPLTVPATEAPALLADDRIDAFFFTVGHPSRAVAQALGGPRRARIVSLSEPALERLVNGQRPYTRATIPVARFYGAPGAADAATFGVLATLCTSARVPDEVVYTLTREVFENLEALRRQHPALAGLTREGMLSGLSAPLHPGARAYFREAGLLP